MKIRLRNKIEAILFLEAEVVPIIWLAEKLGVKEEECQVALKELEADYQKNNSALCLVFTKNKVQLVVRAELALFVKKFFKKEKTEQLSPVMLEVLSIIAYKGPINKAGIEHVRGVNCDWILRKLAIKGLIEKKEQVDNSRIFIYELSLEFLKKLGISKVEDLPNYDKLLKELKVKK